MKKNRMMFWLVVSCLCLVRAALAQAPAWSAAKFQYDNAVAAAHAQEIAERQKLADNHTNQLSFVKLRAQQAGDLDGVKLVLAELERFAKSPTAPPPESAPTPELKNRFYSLSQSLKSVELKTARAVVLAAVEYDKSLLDLQTALTKAGKIEDAKLVREERTRAAGSSDLVEARDLLNGVSKVSATATTSAVAASVPSPPVAGAAGRSLEQRLIGTRWSYPPGNAHGNPKKAFIWFLEGGKIKAEWDPDGESPKEYVWQALADGSVRISWRDRHRIFTPDVALKEGSLAGTKETSVMKRADVR